MLSLPLFLALLGVVAKAQIAYDCPDSVSWLDNRLGQDPCHVASTLLGQCYGGTYNLTALGTTYSGYGGPVSNATNAWTINGCLCNNEMYNLLMACQGACQGKNILTFNVWTGSCNATFTGSSQTPTLDYPQTIPNTTTIPLWAQIDNRNGTWSQQQANTNVTGAAGSTGSTSSNGATGTTSGGGPTGGSSTGGSNNGGGGGSSNHGGAIAGGVIGGLAIVAIVAAAGWYMLRRIHQREAADVERRSSAGRSDGGTMHEVRPFTHPGQAVSPANTTSSGGMRASGSGYGTSGPGSSATHGSQWATAGGQSNANPFQGGTPSPRPRPEGSNSFVSASRFPEVMSSPTGGQAGGYQGGMGGQTMRAPDGGQAGVGDIHTQDTYDAYQGGR